jgi:hypothetical protein
MHRPKEDAPKREIAAPMTHPRHLGEFPESLVEICNDAVGGIHAVIGDVIPDALQIQ